MSVKQFLYYMTNNEDESRHEEQFDIAFFIFNTVVVFAGSAGMIYMGEWPWVSILAIEYTWALDTLRHNR